MYSLMLFETCMMHFLLWKTEDILKKSKITLDHADIFQNTFDAQKNFHIDTIEEQWCPF